MPALGALPSAYLPTATWILRQPSAGARQGPRHEHQPKLKCLVCSLPPLRAPQNPPPPKGPPLPLQLSRPPAVSGAPWGALGVMGRLGLSPGASHCTDGAQSPGTAFASSQRAPHAPSQLGGTRPSLTAAHPGLREQDAGTEQAVSSRGPGRGSPTSGRSSQSGSQAGRTLAGVAIRRGPGPDTPRAPGARAPALQMEP